MAIIVGSARIDERGNAANGQAGDQTKKEVCTEPYYVHALGWYCMRPKDPVKAQLIADQMKAACDNDNIGYDQNQRLGIISAISTYKQMAAIPIKTECDCSSLVRACVMAAGMGDPGNFTTYNECSVLAATGKFEDKFKVTSSTKLYNGDILCSCRKSHTVICVSGSPRPDAKQSQTGGALNKSPRWVGKVIKQLVYVKSWAGSSFSNIKSWPKLGYGNMVDVCDSIKAADGSTWYYIRIAGRYFGFIPSNTLQRVWG